MDGHPLPGLSLLYHCYTLRSTFFKEKNVHNIYCVQKQIGLIIHIHNALKIDGLSDGLLT